MDDARDVARAMKLVSRSVGTCPTGARTWLYIGGECDRCISRNSALLLYRRINREICDGLRRSHTRYMPQINCVDTFLRKSRNWRLEREDYTRSPCFWKAGSLACIEQRVTWAGVGRPHVQGRGKSGRSISAAVPIARNEECD